MDQYEEQDIPERWVTDSTGRNQEAEQATDTFIKNISDKILQHTSENDEETLHKVFCAILKTGLEGEKAREVIAEILNANVVFRQKDRLV